jgi:hypothetical protein
MGLTPLGQVDLTSKLRSESSQLQVIKKISSQSDPGPRVTAILVS